MARGFRIVPNRRNIASFLRTSGTRRVIEDTTREIEAEAVRAAEPDAEFARLAELHARLRAGHPGATELSAGMSDDLERAIAHGSTCVRVGTALLGARPITSA